MEPRDQIFARMYVVLTLLVLAPVLVGVQVFNLTVIDADGLRDKGREQAESFIDLPAMRGNIFDARGRALAVNVERLDVAVDPTVEGFDRHAEEFYRRLSRLTGRSPGALRATLRNRTSPRYVRLATDIRLSGTDRRWLERIPGVNIERQLSRRYNYGPTAAHVLGHVSRDREGLSGIELMYDDVLSGTPGRRAVQRDRLGVRKLIAGGAVTEPIDGESVRLTIDLVLQTILEEELALGVETSGSNWGVGIAMDPRTGAILSLANYPTYDPNTPGDWPTAARRNHAVTDRMEPGSTMKLIAAVAALESGVVDLTDSVETGPGWMVQYGRTLKDTHPYGRISFADVIRLSSNVGTAKVAERLDRGTFYQYARNFGFGQRTYVDMPGEVDGDIKRPSRWSMPTLSAMSRGYEIDATPLQVLAAYAAFANDGVLMRPYVVQERLGASGDVRWSARPEAVRRIFDRETAQRLLPTFESVVTDGTATEAHIPGLRVAGKTGTAKKVINGAYAAGAYRASFVGFFPADDPRVALIVVMDEPESSIYGGSVAAPVFRRTVERWLPKMPEIVSDRMERLARLDSDTNDPADDDDRAGDDAKQGDDAGPMPVRFASLDEGPADETASAGIRIMPDLHGLGLRTAMAELAARGVRVRVKNPATGGGTVAAQIPASGNPLPAEALLTLK